MAKADTAPLDIALERGMPANLDAERFVLGTALLDHETFPNLAALVIPEMFTIEKHRRIWLRMQEIHARQQCIDRVTVAEELRKHGQLESVDGVSYIVSLDEGMPSLTHYEQYARIIAEKYKLRQIILSASRTVNRALDAMDSPEDIAADSGRELVELAERRGAAGAQLAYSVIEEDPHGFFDNNSITATGLKTGFRRLDEMTGGLQKQDLIVIAGRPSMGKTAAAVNICAHVALRGKSRVGLFSLEMTKRALLTRLVCAEARVDLQKFRAGYLDQNERRRLAAAAASLRDVVLAIDDRKSSNIIEIHAAARKLKDKHGLDLIAIDYLQLMTQHTKTDNRARAIGEITKYIKTAICPDLDIPVIVLSQLNREGEKRTGDHRPRLSDLKESGSIEEDADLVAFCYRPEYYDKTREDLKGLAELIIEKQRNGPTGTVKLVFLKEFTKWENRVDDIDDGQSTLDSA